MDAGEAPMALASTAKQRDVEPYTCLSADRTVFDERAASADVDAVTPQDTSAGVLEPLGWPMCIPMRGNPCDIEAARLGLPRAAMLADRLLQSRLELRQAVAVDAGMAIILRYSNTSCPPGTILVPQRLPTGAMHSCAVWWLRAAARADTEWERRSLARID